MPLVKSAVSIAFFFNAAATTEIYTLSLHDALPIFNAELQFDGRSLAVRSATATAGGQKVRLDRKSTRLNSSHNDISYAVFCLQKDGQTPPGFGNRFHTRDTSAARVFQMSL